jgi:catechol-2,3-dioxygenase
MRLGHVVITANDFETMLDFYCATIGLQVSDIGTGAGKPDAPRIAFLSADPAARHHELAILELPPDRSGISVLNHIAFEVPSLELLRERWERVQNDPRSGGLMARGPATAFQGDQWSIRLSDPEGNGVEVYAPTPWDVRAAAASYSRSPQVAFEPIDLTMGDDELATWGVALMDELGLEYWPRGQRPVKVG